MPDRQRRDRRGVDTAGQERADRHIGAHVLRDGVLERRGDLGVAGVLGAPSERADPELRVEVAGEPGGFAGTQPRVVARLQPPDIAMQRLRFGHVLQNRVVLQRTRIQGIGQLQLVQQRQQALLLAAEGGPARAGGQEHRFDPERIAGEEQLTGLGIPDRETEHAAQPSHRVRAPVVVSRDDRFAVTLGPELGAEGGQLGPQLQVVVDLAVERQGVPLRIVGRPPTQRLVGTVDVDDRQPVEAEDQVGVVPGAVFVRAAVTQTG